ncbi:hypothetical protein P691DRAFT_720361 [Macrolepiota fuliginosa MF-IS2]|uniref:Uncharacterized protein n=1 Tax=Macrolepiota fuliginosa MF-IS2 TaxID=1400762 RepID=A0A9P6C9H1_9AGAR|nr:hypothetical protein P691DRAFT_720361 [Macrolepiota fuliginosa MF-IS2]
MSQPLHVHRRVVVRQKIRASKAQVSEIVSDVESYFSFQPFVTKMVQDAANPRLYKITEHIPTPICQWKFSNSFDITFDPVEDHNGRGMDMLATLNHLSFLFSKLNSSVRVMESEESGVVEVVEILDAQILFLLAPFIVSLLREAHEVLLQRLAESVEGST